MRDFFFQSVEADFSFPAEMEKLFDSFKLWIQVRRDYGKRYDPDYHLFRCCEIGNLNICKLLIGQSFFFF